MALSLELSIAFFSAFAIYAFMGVYVVGLDMDSHSNRFFCAVTIALCIWSFSFSISNSAPDVETALFWRRAAALGWGSLYSILLHFVLVLTKNQYALKRTLLKGILYLPAVSIVYIFSISPESAVAHYHLVSTVAGWANVSPGGIWDLFFNCYYVSYMLVCMGLLFQWKLKNTIPEEQKQARLLIVSFAVAFLLGSLTDIVLNSFMADAIPQVAPIIILIPITTIFYAIRKYALLTSSPKDQQAEAGKILSKNDRRKIFQYLSIAFIFGGMVSFVSQYFISGTDFMPSLLFSTFFVIVGFAIQGVRRMQIPTDLQDYIVTFMIAASIPFIILRFIEYGSITVWAVPLVFLVLAPLFGNRRILVILSVVSAGTIIWVWVKAPRLTVQIDGSDHIVRLGIIAIAIGFAYYVNKVYMARLKENENHNRILRVFSQISADFVTASLSNLDEKINQMLARVGILSMGSCSFLYRCNADNEFYCSHVWNAVGESATVADEARIPVEPFSEWLSQTAGSGSVKIAESLLSTDGFEEQRGLLRQWQVESLLLIPLFDNGRTVGFLGFDSVNSMKLGITSENEIFNVLSNMLVDAFGKVTVEKEIEYLAYFDALTGLANRTLFKNRVEQAIHMANRTEKYMGVIFVDLDDFKVINDSMTHEGGDELLKQVSVKLTNVVRRYDTVSRFGGDEFIILVKQISTIGDMATVAEKIMGVFNQPVRIKGQEFFVTASAGMAIYPADGDCADALIQNADLAMYVSKSSGKNQFTLCSPNMKDDVMKRMQLTNGLYRAIERDELVLHYQPQMRISDNQITGVEALIRWNHPELGMISPSLFIPLAEQTGLINSIGQWILETACQQNKMWQDMGLPPLVMAVNLSVEQFRNSGIVENVKRALRDADLSPEYLELEITESVAIKESGHIIEILEELKQIGVTIAIDDFGTEYSSLSRLKELPINRIKIAMEFIQGISNKSKDSAIVDVIIHLSRKLGIHVIAEGVETEEQLNYLKNAECDHVQGYYYFKPVAAEEIEKILFAAQSDEFERATV